MTPPPTILRRAPCTLAVPVGQVPVQRLVTASALGSALGAFQLRTQSVLEYLTGTLLKTW
jgi:hypothetical protein